MKYFLLFGAFILLFIGSISAQKNHTISGYVKEEATGESLLGANVFVKETIYIFYFSTVYQPLLLPSITI